MCMNEIYMNEMYSPDFFAEDDFQVNNGTDSGFNIFYDSCQNVVHETTFNPLLAHIMR